MGKRKHEAEGVAGTFSSLTRTSSNSYVNYSMPTTAGGSASNPIVLDLSESPATKRQRKSTGKGKEKRGADTEKRTAAHRRSCPKHILERVDRVRYQRFFMIDRKRKGKELREEYSVLGSTGNVYTVVIDKKPSCNCPDAMRGYHCKHILFIFLKVLQVPQTSDYWYQRALLTSELETIFAGAPLAPNDVANARVREAYAKATGKAPEAGPSKDTGRKLPGPDDDCAICYDTMHGVAEADLAFCETCGNALHNECFQQWARTSRNGLTCVYCRSAWAIAAPSKSGISRFTEGYINLGNVANLSSVRDTSTYYNGPRRGKRYQDFPDLLDGF